MPDFGRIRVLLNNYGLLHWEPGGIFRTTCDIDITYFPFDEQHCPLLIGAYSYYRYCFFIVSITKIKARVVLIYPRLHRKLWL